MALVRRGSRKRIIAFANSLPPHADDNSWLAIVDGGDYVRSWETSAASFQSTISKEEWVARLEKVRRPLGKVISRKLRSLKHTASGTRQEVEFDTSFDGLPAAAETVTFAVTPNDEWKVIGYLIRPREIATPRQSWWTWSPLQSPEVGEICSHLTKAEQNHVSVLGLISSAWIVGTCFGIPAFIRSNSGPGKWIVALVWVVLLAVSIPMLQRMVRHFLCSTAWARERGFAPGQLRLFSFSRGNLWKVCAVLAVGLGLIFAQSKLFTHLSGVSELDASLKEDAARTKLSHVAMHKPRVTPAPTVAPTAEQPEAIFGPAYGHEQEFRQQLAESVPMKEYGYTIKDLMFSDDYRKALVVFTHTNNQEGLDNSHQRPDWEFSLESNGFRRYSGMAMQPFYTPGTANTPPVYVTVVVPGK
jgi:hypothetical protein